MNILKRNTLPNTSDDINGKNTFESYLEHEQISLNTSDAVCHYQASACSNFEVDADQLNFCLEVEAEGVQSSCAIDGVNLYGMYTDHNYKLLSNALFAEFELCSYQFDSKSTVYKGISHSKVFYKKFDPNICQVDDIISVNTFFSTTVSEEKAKNFGSIILKITGLENAICIVPPIAIIPGAGSLTHEQEILIKPKFSVKVIRVSNNEIDLEIQA